MLKTLEILLIMKLYARVYLSVKLLVFDRYSCFWKKRTAMFACDLISKNYLEFVP